MRTQIIKSQVEPRGIVVEWSDGIEFIFDAELRVQDASLFDDRREIISRTSARETLNGCGAQKVSR